MLGSTATFLLVSLVFPAAFSYRVATSEVVTDFTLVFNTFITKLNTILDIKLEISKAEPLELLSNSLTSDQWSVTILQWNSSCFIHWYRIAACPMSTTEVFTSSMIHHVIIYILSWSSSHNAEVEPFLLQPSILCWAFCLWLFDLYCAKGNLQVNLWLSQSHLYWAKCKPLPLSKFSNSMSSHVSFLSIFTIPPIFPL